MEPADIVTGMQAGEEAAGEALYCFLLTTPRRHMQHHLGWGDNEDRVHDLFLVVSRAILEHRLTKPAALYGYIWTAMRNLSFDAIRRRYRAFEPLSLLTPDTAPDAEAMLIAAETGVRLRLMLDRLKPRDREAVSRYLLEEPTELTERAMGLSPNALRIVRSRAVSRLRVLANAQ